MGVYLGTELPLILSNERIAELDHIEAVAELTRESNF